MHSTGRPGEADATVGLLDVILDELRAGRAPDIDRLAAAHGEDPEEVRQLVSVVQMVQKTADRVDPTEDLDARVAFAERKPVLGDFRIEREIGRGGMGVVYEATQLSLNRRVALKVLLPGVSLSRRALERFQREFKTAGSLHHTHIVPVYAVGECEGVHYYAMQFIEGRSLAAFIRSGREQRFRPDAAYFRRIARWGMQIADGLDYAHQRGVIHRDIKPANIMRDADDNIWLTDFGLARQVDCQTITEGQDVLGTARYMSPEQARGGAAVVDERTDVYSLGVTLYELATLHPPFDGPDRESILRQVTHDPPRSPTRTCATMPRELETIVLKALEKDPERRYLCASLVAEDLRRFLAGEPLLAQRPTMLEEAARFVRRHAALVTLVSAAFSVLLVFSIWMSVLYAQVDRNYARAIRAEGDAHREAEAATAAAASLGRLFQSFAPRIGEGIPELGETMIATSDLLAHSEERVSTDFAQMPEMRAELLDAIAAVRAARWEYAKAAALYEAALEARRACLPPDHPQLVESVRRYSTARRLVGDRVGALEAAREAVELDRGNAAASPRQRARSLRILGEALVDLGRNEEAAAAFDETCDLLATAEGGPPTEIWDATLRLANVRHRVGLFEQAERGYLAVHEALVRLLGPDSSEPANVLRALATMYIDSGEFDRARKLLDEALAWHTRVHGPHHPSVADDLIIAGRLAAQRGDGVAALEPARRAVQIREEVFGQGHPYVAGAMIEYARALLTVPDYLQAASVAREAIEIIERVSGPDARMAIGARRVLAQARRGAGRADEAIPIALDEVERQRRDFPEDALGLVEVLTHAASMLDSGGREAEAAPLLREALTVSAGARDVSPRRVVTLKVLLARAVRPHDPAEAERLFRESLDAFAADEESWTELWYANTLVDMAWTLQSQGRAAEAEPFSAAGVERVEFLRPDDATTFGKALAVRGLVLLALDRPAEAERVMRRCLDLRARHLPEDHYLVATCRSILGEALVSLGRLDEAEPLLCAALDILTQRFPAEHEFIADTLRRLRTLEDRHAALSDAGP